MAPPRTVHHLDYSHSILTNLKRQVYLDSHAYPLVTGKAWPGDEAAQSQTVQGQRKLVIECWTGIDGAYSRHTEEHSITALITPQLVNHPGLHQWLAGWHKKFFHDSRFQNMSFLHELGSEGNTAEFVDIGVESTLLRLMAGHTAIGTAGAAGADTPATRAAVKAAAKGRARAKAAASALPITPGAGVGIAKRPPLSSEPASQSTEALPAACFFRLLKMF